MEEQGLQEWEKHAKETYNQLIKSKPTKENAILLSSAMIIMAGSEIGEIFDMKMRSKDRMQNRSYDRYNRYDEYENRYDNRRNY